MLKLTYAAEKVRCTSFAMSTEETRYYLNGVCFNQCGTHVETAATDGHRLAVWVDDDAVMFGATQIILPISKALKTALKAKKNEERYLVVTGSGNVADFHSVQVINNAHGYTPDKGEAFHEFVLGLAADPSYEVYSEKVKLIDGTFPDYRRVIPQTVDFKPAAFSAKYVADFAEICAGKPFSILTNDLAPALVKTEDTNFLGVLMPMRTGSNAINPALPGWLNSSASDLKAAE